jgi:cell division septal protein FtsQ
MAELPMTKERQEEIKQKKALERKAKFRKSMTVLIGMGAAVILIVGFVIGYLIIRGI